MWFPWAIFDRDTSVLKQKIFPCLKGMGVNARRDIEILDLLFGLLWTSMFHTYSANCFFAVHAILVPRGLPMPPIPPVLPGLPMAPGSPVLQKSTTCRWGWPFIWLISLDTSINAHFEEHIDWLNMLKGSSKGYVLQKCIRKLSLIQASKDMRQKYIIVACRCWLGDLYSLIKLNMQSNLLWYYM